MRWLSPLIASGLLLPILLAGAPYASAASVDGGGAQTDRTSYFPAGTVTSWGNFTYSGGGGPGTLDDAAFVEWRHPNGTVVSSLWTLNYQKGGGTVRFSDAWVPPASGAGYRVEYTMNTTLGSGGTSVLTVGASFAVYFPSEYARVHGIAVATNPPAPYNNTDVTAVASMIDLPGWIEGNASLVQSVRFTWRDPALAVVRTMDRPAAGGLTADTWRADRTGTGFTVTATYLGIDPVGNATSFDVGTDILVAASVGNGELKRWVNDPRPWWVCGDVLVASGGALEIEAGATVRFCPGASLTVSGALRAGSSAGSAINLVPEVPGAGGAWRGVLLTAGSGTSSVLRNVRIEGGVDGITAAGASPSLYNVTIHNGTGAGVRLADSYAVLSDVVVTNYTWGLQATRSRPFVLGFTATAVTTGLDILDAQGTYEDLDITAAAFGFNLTRSLVTIRRASIDVADSAVAARDRSGGEIAAATLSGARSAVQAVDVPGLTFREATLAGGPQGALDATNSTLTAYNTTFTAGGTDLVLFSSLLTLVNATFDEADRLSLGSVLVVKNFLHVRAENLSGAPIAGATVSLVSAADAFTRTTGADGMSRWNEVTDHRVLANGLPEVYSPRLDVTKPGHETLARDPLIDMAVSHAETFVLRPLTIPAPVVLEAAFTAVPAFLTMDFQDTSTPSEGAIVIAWVWEFGDGRSSTARSPRHTYGTPGTYEVRLVVWDSLGAVDFVLGNVTANAPVLVYDTDGDGMQNTWEVFYGLDPDNASDAGLDPDGDTYTNLEEFVAQTDPRDDASHPEPPTEPPPPAGPPLLPIVGSAIAIIALAVVFDLFLIPAFKRRRRESFLDNVTLRAGTVYMIVGRVSRPAYHLFLRASADRRGLIVTRVPPATLRRRHALGDTPVTWLGRIPGGWRTSLTSYLPTNLGGIHDGIAKHLEGQGGVVLLDGLEYLLTENEFPKVVRFLQKAVATAAQHRGVIIVPFDIDTVSAKKEAVLTRNIEVL